PLAHAAPRPSAALANPQSFEDVVRLIDERRDIGLKLDVEKFLRPISFRPGALVFEAAPGAPSNLAQRLVTRLKEWTAQPWLVATEGGGGAETLLERQTRARAAAHTDALAEPFVQAVMDAFPGTQIVDVRQMAVPGAALADLSNAEED
nr:DNA polymerase III subunit gamma/tau [Pseudomonadota bacterium]